MEGSSLRPDGASLTPWYRGRQLVWDVTCTHTLGMSNLNITRGQVGKASLIAEEKKLRKYQEFQPRYIFIPIVFETLGICGPMAEKLLKEVGKRQEEIFGSEVATKYLRQRLSIELQRGNARCVLFSVRQ